MVAGTCRAGDAITLQRHGRMSCGQEAGVVAKKKTLRADEQDRPDVVRRRMNFAIARRFANLDQLVFLDESSAKTNMTRLYGRAPVGQRCYASAPHGQRIRMRLPPVRPAAPDPNSISLRSVVPPTTVIWPCNP